MSAEVLVLSVGWLVLLVVSPGGLMSELLSFCIQMYRNLRGPVQEVLKVPGFQQNSAVMFVFV